MITQGCHNPTVICGHRERVYDTVAKEYSETFSGEHEKKPKDQEILYNQRFDPLFTLDPFMTPLPFTCLMPGL